MPDEEEEHHEADAEAWKLWLKHKFLWYIRCKGGQGDD